MILAIAPHVRRAIKPNIQHTRLLRVFSKSTSPQREPLSHVGAWGFLRGMAQSRSTVQQYKEKGVFSPVMSNLVCSLVMGITQLPRNVVVDLPEFLDGATTAMSSVLLASGSEDFSRFAVARGQGGAAKKRPQSKNAQLLRKWCTPRCYEELEDDKRQTWVPRRTVERQSVDIQQASLMLALYDRLTESELASNEKLAQFILMQRKWSEDATVERLQMHVAFSVKERAKHTLFDQKKVLIVDSEWRYAATFLSRVTSPEEIDWRVTKVTQGKMLSGELISESVLRK